MSIINERRDMKSFIQGMLQPDISRRALWVALIVGTILNAINHYELFMGATVTIKEWVQLVMTYIVPYVVSAHGQLNAGVNNS